MPLNKSMGNSSLNATTPPSLRSVSYTHPPVFSELEVRRFNWSVLADLRPRGGLIAPLFGCGDSHGGILLDMALSVVVYVQHYVPSAPCIELPRRFLAPVWAVTKKCPTWKSARPATPQHTVPSIHSKLATDSLDGSHFPFSHRRRPIICLLGRTIGPSSIFFEQCTRQQSFRISSTPDGSGKLLSDTRYLQFQQTTAIAIRTNLQPVQPAPESLACAASPGLCQWWPVHTSTAVSQEELRQRVE